MTGPVPGLSFRRAAHWHDQGWIDAPSDGTGHRRRWTRQQIAVASLMVRLVDAGMTPGKAAVTARLLLAEGEAEIGPGLLLVIHRQAAAPAGCSSGTASSAHDREGGGTR